MVSEQYTMTPIADVVEQIRKGGMVVLVDDELCNGCEACIDACPLDALIFDRDRDTVLKCDLCGGDPECVRICPREVLILKEVDPASPARVSFRDETAELLSKMRSVGTPDS